MQASINWYLDKLKIVRSEFCKLSAEDFDFLTLFFRTSTLTASKNCRTTARIIFQFVDRRYRIRERLRSRCERMAAILHPNARGAPVICYLKTDALLLVDIFENFRNSCIASYCLDPAHYYTLPGFTWDAMLKHTHDSSCSPTLI